MSKVQFIQDSHRYVSDDGSELISVSKFTERFKEKTDWKKVANKIAKKESANGNTTTTDDILKKWENKRDISAKVGTMYHNIREQELLNLEGSPVFYEKECSVMNHEFEGENKYSIDISCLQNDTVYPELMIYDFDNMICGQSDKVIIVDNKIHIWDYKTDAEIKFSSFSSKWVKPKKLLGPLSHLDECNGNIYSIKMSIYMYLLWKANKGRFKPGDIVIEHIHLKRDPENDNIPVLIDDKPFVEKIETITIPYRRKEVIEMLKSLKNDS
jgi:ATP-dependent exoDNAse (exonuclease V) beta subunit